MLPGPKTLLDARKRFIMHVAVIIYNHLPAQLQIVAEIRSIEDDWHFRLKFLYTFPLYAPL